MSNQTTSASASATRRAKTKVKPIKNQPALGLFIEECQKAGIFKNLSKISDSKNKKISTNKRQRQPTGSSTQAAEKKKKAGDPSDDIQTNLTDKGYLELCNNMVGIDLLQELKNMEQRITATLKNDKESEIMSMEERLTNNLKHTIDQSMKEAIQTLTSQNAQTISNNPTVQQNCREIRDLQEENARLTKQVQVLSSEQNKLQHKITLMEQKSLENCLVFRGLSEDISKNDYNVREKVYKELAHTFEGNNYAMNLSMAKNIAIKSCKRVGRFSHTRPRPVSVELEHIQDVEFIMENKGYLQRGVYVDREYIPEIERKRRILLPVLKAAKQCKDYKKKCRLEDDKVVINGRKYGIDNLHQLPREIDPFAITSKSDENCIGFFGALKPLSNFYETKFTVAGVEYLSSEQFIQAQKANYFKDEVSYNRVMGATTSLDCKNAARSVRNFDRPAWEAVAESLCKEGLKAKFSQNPHLSNILITKTGNKTLVECANDRLWANGIPLYSDTCLNQQRWISQGLLGKLLEEVRSELSTQLGANHPSSSNILPPTINVPPADQITIGIMGNPNTITPEEEAHPPQQPNSTSSMATGSGTIASNRDESMSENEQSS